MKILRSFAAVFMMVLLIGNTAFAQESEGSVGDDGGLASDESITVENVYKLDSPYGYKYLIAQCKTTSNENLDVSWDTVSYNKDGGVIETGSSYNAYVAPGQKFIMYALFLNSDNATNYSYNIHYEKSTYMIPAFSDVNVSTSVSDEKTLTITATNTSKTDISTVQVSTLFFDADDHIIGFDDSYLVNSNYNLEAGETISKDVSIPTNTDNYEYYYTAYRW